MGDLVPQFIDIIKQYGYWFVFFGTIVGGESVILAATFLAFLGILNIYCVIALSVTGTLIADNAWYIIGYKSQRAINWLTGHFFSKKDMASFNRRLNNHYGKLLMVSRFVYGTRIITLLTFGHQKVGFKKFFWWNLLAIGVWTCLLLGGGYVLSFSWDRLDEYSHYVRYLIVLVLAAIIVVRYLFKKVAAILSDYESRN